MEGEATTSSFASDLRRWWSLVVLATVAAGATAYFAADRAPETYEAEARLLTGPLNTDFATLQASGQLALTFAELATSNRVLASAGRGLGLAPNRLRGRVTATANEKTRLLTIRAEAGTPEAAASVANTLAAELIDLSEGSVRPEGRLRVVDAARAPSGPAGPRPLLIAGLAAALGLGGALGLLLLIPWLAYAFHRDDDALREAEDVRATVLGDRSGRVLADDHEPIVETLTADAPLAWYADVAAKLTVANGGSSTRTLLVAGVGERSAAASVAANLATAFGQERSVVLVDTAAQERDGREPPSGRRAESASPAARLERATGRRPEPADGAVRRVAADVGSSELVAPDAARGFLDRLLAEAGLVIVSAPENRPRATLPWAQVTEAVVVVVRRGCPRQTLADFLDELALARANVVAIVLAGDGVGRRQPV